ncbi:MAG: gatB [Candidatus Kaiserbacteria bacterium]|nr:gatB [Candidatus Kaiserbacteria bacterium]
MNDADSEYEVTIGLEVHAELKTATKMFCNSKNDPDEERPNVNVCPVCMAHPGSLPVINREAVRQVLRVGTALGSKLADYTEFDRKNYFYPDLPKGYQISQFEYPLVAGGMLNGVEITRIHLEEDTASSMHDDATGETSIDYNRGGVPLMELVTEPVMHSAQEAGDFGRELQLLLRYLGASEANMEKGQMRVEANVSVAKKGTRSVGYVEIKNLNSFRTMERAVEYEIKRQTELVKGGGIITKQTLGWDENKQATFVQRTKEGAADYRYFPDPDLPSLKLSEIPEFDHALLRESLPELPATRRMRYVALGIKPDDADAYVRDLVLGTFFENVIADKTPAFIQLASNYIANDLVKIMRDGALATVPVSVSSFRAIIELVESKKLSSRGAKDLLVLSATDDRDPETIAREKGLIQDISPEMLQSTIVDILEKNPTVVADYKSGKEVALQFLLGQGMKAFRGAIDPDTLKRIVLEQISLL